MLVIKIYLVKLSRHKKCVHKEQCGEIWWNRAEVFCQGVGIDRRGSYLFMWCSTGVSFFFELELHVEEVHFILVLFNLIKSSLKY